MKKTIIALFFGVFAGLCAHGDTDRILYLDDLRKLANDEDSQVMVATVPITSYVIDAPSQTNIQVFFDSEIKISDYTHPLDVGTRDKPLSTNNVIVYPRVRMELASFNLPVNIYLDARTNDWFSIYYFDIKMKTVKRLEQEHYDTLLESIIHDLGVNADFSSRFRDENEDMVPAAPYFYICIDGRKFDKNKTWFYEGNHTIEAHALRLFPWGQLENYNGNMWVPLEVHWFKEVPDFLRIPKIDYSQADSPFWRLFHSSH